MRTATPARWNDLEELFVRPGPRGGKPFTDGCWCQFWHLRGKAYDAGWGEPNRQRLERQVRSRRVPGLLAYLAARRTQEFGVRLALGATRAQVIELTVRQAVVVTAVGLAAGAGLALALGQVMASVLFGLVSLRFWPMAAMTALIGMTALVAGYLPARRAADLDPTEALRTN